MANLRAGLVGLGVMGRHHLRLLNALEGVDFVGVADPGVEDADLVSTRFDSLAALLAAGLDYCVVAVPTALHVEVGLRLAEAGVHALVEKPLAFEPKAAEQLAEAFAARGLVGAVGHVERYNPALQSARARIANGDLGAVYQVATRRQGPFPARIADVGVVKDLATHDIDLTSWVVEAAYQSVFAQTAHRSGRQFEDLVSVTGMLDRGIVTSHLVNWVSPFKERVTVISGELGAFVADTLSADLTFYANGLVPTEWDEVANFRGVREGDVIRYAIAKPEPLRLEHEAFRDAVLGKRSDIVTMEQGVAVTRIADAILRSAESGASVRVAG
ncbi:MAG: Gfo/Idh/MocA family oxidoreductase [Actinomycetota bacterium]|nr:Gfo/Idh/MocA family oxidoreductase [Actinomycetota bacterium]